MNDTGEELIETPQNATATRLNGVRLANLVLGDILVFLIFAAIGRKSHGEAAGLNTIVQIVATASPFLVGWFIVSPFLGAFRRGLEAKPAEMAKKTLLAWICAWPVAMILRGIFVDHAVPPWTFWIVAFVANTILLLVWRVPVAFLGQMRERGQR